MKKYKKFTAEETKLAVELRKAGKSYKEIAYALDRDIKSIEMKFYQLRKEESAMKKTKQEQERKPVGLIANGENKGVPVMQMSPREMIKALYDMGYRIENNQLVCYVKQRVNLSDIITEGK